MSGWSQLSRLRVTSIEFKIGCTVVNTSPAYLYSAPLRNTDVARRVEHEAQSRTLVWFPYCTSSTPVLNRGTVISMARAEAVPAC